MPTKTINVTLPRMRRDQWTLYDDMSRFNCWVCHRRFGKTVLAEEILLAKAASNRLPDPRYAYFAPTRIQAKDVAWTYLQRFTQDIPGIEVNQSDLFVTLPGNGARIRLYGADNAKLGAGRRGIYLDGVVIDEYADISPALWDLVLRPMLTDRKGWAIFIGTPRGKNHFYHLYRRALQREGWSTALFRADQTGVIDPDELQMIYEEAVEDGKLADYEQEYLCSWDAPMPGAVYAEQLRRMDAEGRICHVPYDPSLPTYTAWDLGVVNNAIWWLQPGPERYHFIDYEEGAGSLEHWIRVVREKPYIYDYSKLTPPLTRAFHEVHYGPHDLDQQDYGYGKTRYTIALDQTPRFQFSMIPQGVVEDGIAAGRRLMDKAVIDEKLCEKGLNGMRSYRYGWDDIKQTYSTTPIHDWASHPADGWRTAAVGLLPPPMERKDQPKPGSFAHMQKIARRHAQGRPLRGSAYKAFGEWLKPR